MDAELNEILDDENKNDKIYPGVSDRVKAALADSVVLIIFMKILTAIFSDFESVSDNARMIAFVFIFGLYDPICTSSFGGRIGHRIMKIRVKEKVRKRVTYCFRSPSLDILPNCV